MSAGIDSPVAIHLMLERGARVTVLHFDNRPFTDDAEVGKARALVARLRELHGELPAYLVPHGETTQLAMAREAPRRIGCVLCRRMMFRVAAAFARSIGADGVLTGESLGQVASQTLANIAAENDALGGVPAVRPLIGMDKDEIVRIARDIGTYGPSTAPGSCCTIVPSRPAVAARRSDVEGAEALVDIKALAEAALGGMVEW
jgi:thiamine biosynthesis protein ThiI